MSHGLSESAIVRAVAQDAARRITLRVIRTLRQMRDTLSGDDSGLQTTWDEICAQLQYEESLHWDVYHETVCGIVRAHIGDLPKHERQAIWLQTDNGINWEIEKPEKREPNPVCDDDIINWLTHEYVYAEAANWSNARIRAYVDRSNMRD